MISGSHRGAVAHAERVHSYQVGPFIADHERVANERQRATVKSIPNSELVAYCVRRPSARGSEPRLHEPVVQAERVHRDRVERFGLGHERVANEREHSTAKKRLISAVVHCAVYPNTHGPVTRRVRCRAGSERVQRDRVGKFGLCHAWVANESRSIPKLRRVVHMLSFGTQQ